MFELYQKTSADCSKKFTHAYSTSFSLGIRMFHKRFRQEIYNIYGFVRLADEIVDTMHAYPKNELLEEFRVHTLSSIERGVSVNPILQSFQETVHKFQIDKEYIIAFLDSMQMDLEDIQYEHQRYKKYIYGSAEVIGLMCLKVFCEGNESLFTTLALYARSLGSAFQKVNFLRDVRSDFYDRGRVYFPEVNFENWTEEEKNQIEMDIERDFTHALVGIRQLPSGCRFGVYTAYLYYQRLFLKIRKAHVRALKQKRIRISNSRKLYLLAVGALSQKFRLG